jgi:DNA-binding transcriptional ArsR family regulator
VTSAVEVVRDTERAALLLDPTRQSILENLDVPDSAAGLARKLGMPRQRLNYHLRELERCQLVELAEERRKGNCTERLYRRRGTAFVISPEALGKLSEGLDRVDRMSSAYQVAMAARAIQELAVLRERAAAQDKALATFALQVDVRFKDAAARAEFAAELSDAVSKLVERYHDERTAGGRTFRFYLGGYPAPEPAPR